jgi:hypothetical protein
MDDLPFRVVRSNRKDEPSAAAYNLLVARAAFEKCAELYPADLIELKHGIRVIDKSLDIGTSDPREALLANYRPLAVSLRMIRGALEESFGAAAELPASEQFETLPQECEAIVRAIRGAAADAGANQGS